MSDVERPLPAPVEEGKTSLTPLARPPRANAKRIEALLSSLNMLAALATILGVFFYLKDAPARDRSRLVEEGELYSRSRADLAEFILKKKIDQRPNRDDPFNRGCAAQIDSLDDATCLEQDEYITPLPSSILYGLAGGKRILHDETLTSLNLYGADLHGFTVQHTKFDRVIVEKSRLAGSTFDRSSLAFSTISDSDAQHVCITQTNMDHFGLKGSDLSDGFISPTSMMSASFTDSTLARSIFVLSPSSGMLVFAFDDMRWMQIKMGTENPEGCMDASPRPLPQMRSGSWVVREAVPKSEFQHWTEPLTGHVPVMSHAATRPPQLVTSYIVIAYSDLRGAHVDLSPGPGLNRLVVYANVCVDALSVINPKPEPEALDCTWLDNYAKETADQPAAIPPLRTSAGNRHLFVQSKNLSDNQLAVVTAETDRRAFVTLLHRFSGASRARAAALMADDGPPH